MPEFIRKAKEFSDDYKAQGAYLKKLLKGIVNIILC